MPVSPVKEAADIIKEEGGDTRKLCYQCGTCTGTCPWNNNTLRNFSIRQIMHQTQLGLPDFESDDMWLCVTCKACVDRCPRGVEIIDVWKALRKVIVEVGAGKTPDSLRLVIKNISGVGNPQGEDREKRMKWAKEAGIKPFTKGMEVLYFPCCYNAYDSNATKAAQATAAILGKAGVDFGMLGEDVSCCGESVRKAGNESLFQTLAQGNIELFKSAGVKKILVSSPHCYHTFKNEYKEFGGNFEVVHLTQYLAQLVKEGRLKFTKELKKKITYHDSCYLGRHNNIYDEPRQILKAIPGVELVEMYNNHKDSLCCGGGGGRVWEETKKGERFSDVRVEQALEVGANVLATACPYCMVMLKDSILTSGKENEIDIKDVVELAQEAL